MTAYNKYPWSDAEIQFLKVNFFSMTNPALAIALGLKLTSVRTKCYELGLKRMDLEYWSDEQIKYLRKNFTRIGDKELAVIFDSKWPKGKGWTLKHIEKKRSYLKLKRTKEELRAIKTRNAKAGNWSTGKTWATRGVSKIGAIVQWKSQYGKPFLAIKTKNGFVHYPRYLYKKVFGRIPAGMVVRLKDGNPLNVIPENLELLTRGENAVKNAGWEYPEEIRTALRTINKIKKVIYEKQND